jgi:hypothetical protein
VTLEKYEAKAQQCKMERTKQEIAEEMVGWVKDYGFSLTGDTKIQRTTEL